MSTHKDVVAEYYAAFNRRDPDVYARLFTKDCELVAPGIQVAGVDAMRAFDEVWSSAFSEARIESMRMLESDGAILSGNWFHGGTHTRPLQTPAGAIPASGRSFEAPYCAMFEFDGDRIKTQRIVFDADYVRRRSACGELGRELSTNQTTNLSHLSIRRRNMSEQDNLDIVMGIYEAFGRGDLAAVLNRMDPQADLQFEGPSTVPWTGNYHGREGWTKFFQTLGGNVDEITMSMEPFAAQGDRVVVSGRYQGRVKATARRIDSPLVHLWTLRNGMVVRCLELTNTAAEAAACTAGAAVSR